MTRAALVLFFCQVIWSLGGVVITLEPLPVVNLMALALLSAGVVVGVAAGRRALSLASWRLRAEATGFGVANGLCNLLSGLAILLAGVGNAAFAIAATPLFIVIIARPLTGDRLPARAVPALLLGALGVGLLLAAGRGADGGQNVMLGLLCGLLAALLAAVSALGGRRLAPRIGVEAAVAWTLFIGGLSLLPFVEWRAFLDIAPLMLPLVAIWITGHFVIAPVLYTRAARIAPAFVLAAATFVNTALAPVWGALIFGERLLPLALAGVGLALAANVLLMLILRNAARNTAQPEPAPTTPTTAPAL